MPKLMDNFRNNVEAAKHEIQRNAIIEIMSNMDYTLGDLHELFKDLQEQGAWKNVSSLTMKDLHTTGRTSAAKGGKDVATSKVKGEAKVKKTRMTQPQKMKLMEKTLEYIKKNPGRSKSEIGRAVKAKTAPAPSPSSSLKRLSTRR